MVGMWFFNILSKRNTSVNFFFLQDFGISFQDLLGRSNKKIELTLRKLVIFRNNKLYVLEFMLNSIEKNVLHYIHI